MNITKSLFIFKKYNLYLLKIPNKMQEMISIDPISQNGKDRINF